MSVRVQAAFTSMLRLKSPWKVVKDDLDNAKRRVALAVACGANQLPCTARGVNGQGIHDRVRRDWRRQDFFQHEARLHAGVPRVDRDASGVLTAVEAPWARLGGGFSLLFEAFAQSMCQSMPVAHAAALLRINSKQLRRRIEHYVGVVRAPEKMNCVAVVVIDDLSFRRGHDYVTAVHDLEAKRLQFMTEGRTHGTVIEFTTDLIALGGKPDDIKQGGTDTSADCTKGVTKIWPQAEISFDRFHVSALAKEAMNAARRDEMRDRPRLLRAAMGTERNAFKGMFWGMRKDYANWDVDQINTMYRLQRSNPKCARAWGLKEGLRSTCAAGVTSHCFENAEAALKNWMFLARRSRLDSFKNLATPVKDRLAGVVRGMLDSRSNAHVEAMNDMLQQVARAGRGFRTVKNFVAFAYLRTFKLKTYGRIPCLQPHLRDLPFAALAIHSKPNSAQFGAWT